MRYDDASKALVGLAASRHNAFHTSEAAAINFSTKRLRRAQLRDELYLLHPKVWAFRDLPSSPAQTLRAATLSVPGSAASLMSAAWLHGWIETPPPVPQLWHAAGKDRRRNAMVVNQRSGVDPGRDITVSKFIPTLNKAATLCLLGITANRLVVEKCLDEFLRTESTTWLMQTRARLDTRWCKGSRTLADILDDPQRVDGVPDSWLERVTSNLVNLDSIPPIELQYPVLVGGRRLRVDIACPELKLGIEFHSRQYHWGVAKEDADNNRDWLLSSAGWHVLYVTYSHIMRPDEFIRLFTRVATARAKLFA